uniref:Bm11600 n=1 Tax=Brugia malayi TaxID=6279 RepID=A0A1I9G9T1_BRUMA|nr:Bm11600 [Brugia malayi]
MCKLPTPRAPEQGGGSTGLSALTFQEDWSQHHSSSGCRAQQQPPQKLMEELGQALPTRPAHQPPTAQPWPPPQPPSCGSLTYADSQPDSTAPRWPTPVDPPLLHRGTQPSLLLASQPGRQAQHHLAQWMAARGGG